MPDQNEVKRYYAYAIYWEKEEGMNEYVLFSDYAALQAKCEELETIASGRTVSCSNCNQAAKRIAELEARIAERESYWKTECAKQMTEANYAKNRCEQLEEALRAIIKHQEAIIGSFLPHRGVSTTWRIASDALNPKMKTEEP